MSGGAADIETEGSPRDRIRSLQEIPRVMRLSHVISATSRFVLMGCAVWAWSLGLWWVVVPIWVVVGWMDHAALTRMHEAAHGTLVRSKWLNETTGIVIGTLALTPLSVYRFVHHQHHAYVGQVRDPEFWPYSDPSMSRAFRVFHAWIEIVFGWILTPVLYSYRTARSWSEIPGHQRRRLILEWIILVGFWGGVAIVMQRYGWWPQFVVAHLVPAWIAGTLQTTRKFTEHMGMFGEGILGITRTVAHERLFGRALSRTQLHVDHHGTHHRWARIPYYALPEATEIVYADAPEGRLFANYAEALRDMIPHLRNPRVGPQWKAPGPDAGPAKRR